MKNEIIRTLSPGKVFIDYGPVSMVITAFHDDQPLTELSHQVFEIIYATLREITDSLALLRLPASSIPKDSLQGLPLKMLQAVQEVAEPSLTPMATVAGAMSDTVADWLFEQGANRVIINNGGDIALRLAPNQKVRVGILSSLASREIDTIIPISAEDGIGGIATSGLGGRSFTRGVANAVSVFSNRCILADALATHLANKSFVLSNHVSTVKAKTIDPLSDIADLDIVTRVDQLTNEEINQALANIKYEASQQYTKKLFLGMRANVQNKFLCFPENFENVLIKYDKEM